MIASVVWSTLLWITVVGTAIWVGFDAQQLGVRAGMLGGGLIDMGAAGWGFCVLLLWIVAFPAYLATRPRYVWLSQQRRLGAPGGPGAPIAPGWYADPSRRFESRYWDGAHWTAYVSRAGGQFVDPL